MASSKNLQTGHYGPVSLKIFTVLAGAAAFVAVRSATAQTIIPISQSRHVGTEALFFSCPGGGGVTDEDAAEGFGPFDSVLTTEDSCPAGSSMVIASQQSRIDASSITASGSTFGEATPSFSEIHAFAHSNFSMTFALDSAIAFALVGLITVDAQGPFDFVNVQLCLTGPGNEPLFQHQVQALAGGADSQIIEEGGILEPGMYTLFATSESANKFAGAEQVTVVGQASFELTFDVSSVVCWNCLCLDEFKDAGESAVGCVVEEAACSEFCQGHGGLQDFQCDLGPCTAIPAVSLWGMIVTTLLLLTTATVVLRRPGWRSQRTPNGDWAR